MSVLDKGFSRGSGPDVCKISQVKSGRVKRCSKYECWAGSGRVGSGLVGAGRGGAGGFRISGVGPYHPDPSRPSESLPTLESPGVFGKGPD